MRPYVSAADFQRYWKVYEPVIGAPTPPF